VGLHLHRSERADVLVAVLAEVLAEQVADPFAPDVVAVPARGVERWLSQRLAHKLGATGANAGVCANVNFPSPVALVAEAVGAVAGERGDDDPWASESMVWRLLDVVAGCSGEAWCAPLSRHVTDGLGRRFAVAQHVGRLFASYGEQRPQLLRDWQAGRRPTAPVRTCRPTCAGSSNSGGGCAPGSASRARPSGSTRCAPSWSPGPRRSTCRSG
jgi:exodeoxyribonuclease V gamma subunit